MDHFILFHAFFVFGVFSSILISCNPVSLKGSSDISPFARNFLFGAGSSAYQFEGAFLTDGKGLNNWDNFTHKPGKIVDGSDGDVAVDQYHLYLEDLHLMDYVGINSYRFSISWARILPKGRFGSVNMAGIEHYNKFIDALLQRGIEPFVTLTHYDIPQELEDRYGAWLSAEVQQDFKYYADLCFKFFGDRVKYWVTFNEPNVVAIRSYRSGIYPPSRCSIAFGNCTIGDSEREPFIAAHNMIISHSAAVILYRAKYQKEQGGNIGVIMNTMWLEPVSNSSEDKVAAERALAFYMNWFLDPMILGKYPAEMNQILGSDLPAFSKNETENLKNGVDFVGINHYTSFYIKDCIYSACKPGPGVSKTEGLAFRTAQKDGVFIGQPTAIDWINAYPQGLENTVMYIKDRYNNIPMFITENGVGQQDNPNSTFEASINDLERIDYVRNYLDALSRAIRLTFEDEDLIRKGADVRGYFAWSFLDNFEWLSGYTTQFGLYHVNMFTLQRTARLSATWYKRYIANHKASWNAWERL